MPKPKVISLFSGAGGLDYGFEAAGFETAVAVEMNHDACETLRSNRDWTVIEGDIFDVSTSQLLEAASSKRGDVDVLIGGPPCQPFSKSGYWAHGDARRLDDPRSNTLSAFLRVLEEAKPRAFLLENVEGLAFRGKDEGLRLLLNAFKTINKRAKANYKPCLKVVNAADYGVPQLRKRLIIVGSVDGAEFEFPKATHGAEQLELFGDLEPRMTAWDAIGGLIPGRDEDLTVTGRWADLLPTIPEGKNYLHHTARGDGEQLFGWRRHYWTFLLKLKKNLPSWTIQAQPGPAAGPFHWDDRKLSRQELCRLQTFPHDVTVAGTRFAAQKQIGNAVPSLMAEVLARAIRAQLLGLSVRGALKLLPVRASTTPPEAAVARLPKEVLGPARRTRSPSGKRARQGSRSTRSLRLTFRARVDSRRLDAAAERVRNSLNDHVDLLVDRRFPEPQHGPSCGSERGVVATISLDVTANLFNPVRRVVTAPKLFKARLEVTAMPVVPIAEDHNPMATKYDIRLARQRFIHSSKRSEAGATKCCAQ